jgi:hypothetical protein
MGRLQHVLLGIVAIPLALIAWPIIALAIVGALLWEVLSRFGEGLEALVGIALRKVRGVL